MLIKKNTHSQIPVRKILLVAHSFSRFGGIEEVARQVVDILQSQPGISLRIITLNRNRFQRAMGLFWAYWSLLFGYVGIIMHPFLFQRFRLFQWLSFCKPTVIVWAYGIDVWGECAKKKTSNLVNASTVIAISQFTKNELHANFQNLRIKVIPLAASNSILFKLPVKRETFEVLTVARLSRTEQYKGHDLVLYALKLLKLDGYEIKYNIVGAGDDIERLQQIAVNLDVSNQVVFHGYQSDIEVAKLYARSSVFVMPSYVIRRSDALWGGEGFGLVYLEAGLNRLPVIACDEGGQTDCIVENRTGFLIKPDPTEIASRIKFLYRHPEIVEKMGNAGYKNAMETFSSEKFRKNVLKVIDNVIRER